MGSEFDCPFNVTVQPLRNAGIALAQRDQLMSSRVWTVPEPIEDCRNWRSLEDYQTLYSALVARSQNPSMRRLDAVSQLDYDGVFRIASMSSSTNCLKSPVFATLPVKLACATSLTNPRLLTVLFQ